MEDRAFGLQKQSTLRGRKGWPFGFCEEKAGAFRRADLLGRLASHAPALGLSKQPCRKNSVPCVLNAGGH